MTARWHSDDTKLTEAVQEADGILFSLYGPPRPHDFEETCRGIAGDKPFYVVGAPGLKVWMGAHAVVKLLVLTVGSEKLSDPVRATSFQWHTVSENTN